MINSNSKFVLTFSVALTALSLLATVTPSNAAECHADKKSVESALSAKLRIPAPYVCALSNTSASEKSGYVETLVHYAEGGLPDCTRAYAETTVTVKGECNG